MKRMFIFLMLLLQVLLIACSKDSAAPPPVDTGTPPATPPPVTDSTRLGSFVNGAHATSGKATIVMQDGSKKLVLENFRTDAGPDLYIYLSNNTSAGSFINLGRLKSTSGNQEYTITGMPDFNTYRYVLVWCQQFGVLFGSAQIK